MSYCDINRHTKTQSNRQTADITDRYTARMKESAPVRRPSDKEVNNYITTAEAVNNHRYYS